MELLEIMLNRRSTRKFNDKEITRQDLDLILKAALLAPTSMNRKPCNFMVVENRDVLTQLSQSKNHGAELLAGAKKAIVVIGDELIADTWCEDSSIALTHMHLMATELGIGSCWVQIHLRNKNDVDSEEIVRDILKIDSNYRIVGILALGHSDDIPKPHTLDELGSEKIHFLV
jgi:nitroreductase